MLKVTLHRLTYHDWADYRELVIQETCLLNVASLEGDLQTRAAHAEPHTVHVDVVGLSIALSTGVIGGQLLSERGGSTRVLEDCRERDREWK